MNITLYVGPPGCGKTKHTIEEIVSTPGLFLFALPRTDLIEEKARDLRQARAEGGFSLRVEPIHSGQRWSSVSRRIEELAEELSSAPEHAVLLISHDMLTRIDLASFTDHGPLWHARIDETPDALASGRFEAPAAAHYLEQVYDLVPSAAPGWWRVRLKAEAPGPGALMRDTHLRDLVTFDKRARSRQGAGVLVNIGDWRDATLSGRSVEWYSVWTPASLAGFASVGLAAANFPTSLCGLASRRLDAGTVTYVEHRIGSGLRQASPDVRLRYFTQGHRGSTAWWAAGAGKQCLNRVVRHLATVRDLGFYSGNGEVRSYFEGWLNHAEAVRPRLAGTNSLIRHTCCALIYSCKSQDADAAIRVALGFTTEEIERSRETEDLIQFVLRGAIRDPSFAGTYTVYVYDFAQAEVVRDYLVGSGLTSTVTLEGVAEAGIMDEQRPTSRGVRSSEVDERTHEDREQERRSKDAERKRLMRADERQKRVDEGTYRERGRPRKQGTAGAPRGSAAVVRGRMRTKPKGSASTETRLRAPRASHPPIRRKRLLRGAVLRVVQPVQVRSRH